MLPGRRWNPSNRGPLFVAWRSLRSFSRQTARSHRDGIRDSSATHAIPRTRGLSRFSKPLLVRMLMSISALSSNLITDLSQQYQQNPLQQIRKDFNQLASALQSGDLSGTQSAYSSIQQLLQDNQSSSNSTAGSNGSSTIQNDFATLGQALQSGDLSQAQSAFSQLQSDFKAASQSAQALPQGEDQAPSRHHLLAEKVTVFRQGVFLVSRRCAK